MVLEIMLVIIMAFSAFNILIFYFPSVNRRARKSVLSRAEQKQSSFDVVINNIADKIAKYISFDDIKKTKLQINLDSVGSRLSPELFTARSIAKGFIYSFAILPTSLIAPFFLLFVPIIGISVYMAEVKKLDKKIKERRKQIERELPQFAGTIRQALNSSRSIVVILESYRKVCGAALKGEIDKTLNDIKMGNEEKALKNFERRINSSKVSELVRGLIGVVRGEDQRIYFEMIAHEYIKAENENVKRDLLNRPMKLRPYMFGLILCLALMCGVAIGIYLKEQLSVF